MLKLLIRKKKLDNQKKIEMKCTFYKLTWRMTNLLWKNLMILRENMIFILQRGFSISRRRYSGFLLIDFIKNISFYNFWYFQRRNSIDGCSWVNDWSKRSSLHFLWQIRANIPSSNWATYFHYLYILSNVYFSLYMKWSSICFQFSCFCH